MGADDAGEYPLFAFLLPDAYKPRRVGLAAGLGRIVKLVQAKLYGTIAGQGVYFYAAGDQFAAHLAANVLFNAFYQLCMRGRKTTLIMVKLDVFGKNSSDDIGLAMVVGIKQHAIHVQDVAVQGRVGGGIGGWVGGLRCAAQGHGQQGQQANEVTHGGKATGRGGSRPAAGTACAAAGLQKKVATPVGSNLFENDA